MPKIKTLRKEIQFFILFILFFFSLQALESFAWPHLKHFWVDTLTAGGSSKLINFITPEENTNFQKEYISSGNFKLRIIRGCEGMEGVIILVAAILAFPAGIKSKLLGVTGGIFVIYVSNLFRTAGLYYTLKYKPALFDIMHIYVGQTLIILIAFLYFIGWLNIKMNIDDRNS